MSRNIFCTVSVLIFLAQVLTSYARYSTHLATDEELVDTLKQLVSQLQENVESANSVIQNFEDSVIEGLKEVNLTGVLTDLEKKVEMIISNSNISLIQGIKCISTEQKNVQNLIKVSTESIDTCTAKVKPLRNQLTKFIDAIIVKAQNIVLEITKGISKCYYNYPRNPIKAITCLKKLIDPFTESVHIVSSTIHTIVINSQNVTETADAIIDECIQELQKELVSQENSIQTQFKKCVM